MDPRINDLPALRIFPKTIEAVCYNHVRLALRRISNPLRVALPEHRGLEIILSDHYWLCVDITNDDQPIMVWLDFDTSNHNQALHEPVPCQLRLFHTHAGLVMGSALDALDECLAEKLASSAPQDNL